MEGEKHLAKTEKLVRIELQRRQVKDVLDINSKLLEELDERLAFVTQLKRDWLHHRRMLEVDRKQIVTHEALERNQIVEEMKAATENLIFLQWLPELRSLKQSSKHRRGK